MVKKVYRRPVLCDHGLLRRLTQVGNSGDPPGDPPGDPSFGGGGGGGGFGGLAAGALGIGGAFLLGGKHDSGNNAGNSGGDQDLFEQNNPGHDH
jgi:hypothetical protein